MAIEFMRAGVKNAFTLYLLMIISVQPRRKTVGTLAAVRVTELNERTTMANKTLFQSLRGATLVPKTDSVNEAGGRAYELSPKQALAQYALTGCLNSTYYASADDQLANVLALAEKVDADFVAKTAVYARQKGFMKDMPALLCASLSTKDPQLLRAVFDRVIDDGKMLRNFVRGVALRRDRP